MAKYLPGIQMARKVGFGDRYIYAWPFGAALPLFVTCLSCNKQHNTNCCVLSTSHQYELNKQEAAQAD
jgi:hypothetical protein